MVNDYTGTYGVLPQSESSRESYVAARLDDATRETKLHFQKAKSQTVTSYKKEEAYIRRTLARILNIP